MIELKRSYMYVTVDGIAPAETVAAIKALFQNVVITENPLAGVFNQQTEKRQFVVELNQNSRFEKPDTFNDYDISLQIPGFSSALIGDRNETLSASLANAAGCSIDFSSH